MVSPIGKMIDALAVGSPVPDGLRQAYANAYKLQGTDLDAKLDKAIYMR